MLDETQTMPQPAAEQAAQTVAYSESTTSLLGATPADNALALANDADASTLADISPLQEGENPAPELAMQGADANSPPPADPVPASNGEPVPPVPSTEEMQAKAEMHVTVLDFGGDPITGLKVRIQVQDRKIDAATNAEGAIPVIYDLPLGEKATLFVQKTDGSWKRLDELTIISSVMSVTAVSPKIILKHILEQHDGTPGKPAPKATSPKTKPTPNPPAPQKSTAKPAAKTAGSATAAAVPPNISGNTTSKAKVESGRDENGNPISRAVKHVEDWWHDFKLPSLNIWSQEDFKKENKNKSTSAAAPKKIDEAEIKKVNELIKFSEYQASYIYSGTTVSILAKMARGNLGALPTKPIAKSKGKCYLYVKIALARTGIVDGALEGESASSAGPQLILKGFRNIKDEIPDERWASPGDIIVYRWTEETWARRKISYNRQDLPNYGHINIRTYDSYISDFIGEQSPMHLNKYGEFDYDVIGIYRKFEDKLPILRMKAFLKVIRDYECEAYPQDADRYLALNTRTPDMNDSIKYPYHFSSFARHPWEGLNIGKSSTAAGAYQILIRTYKDKLPDLGIPSTSNKFNQQSQDRLAIRLIEARKALGPVRRGEITTAVGLLNTEWSSFPGGIQNKPGRDISFFTAKFNLYLKDEMANAGLEK